MNNTTYASHLLVSTYKIRFLTKMEVYVLFCQNIDLTLNPLFLPIDVQSSEFRHEYLCFAIRLNAALRIHKKVLSFPLENCN